MPGKALQKLTVETWLRPVTDVARLVPLLLPSLLLAGAMQRPWHDPRLHSYFAAGAGLLLIVAVIVYVYSASWRHPASPAVIMLHLTALGWLIFGTRDVLDWYASLSQTVLLIFPLLVLAYHTLRGSGVIEVRRAQLLAEVIKRRPDLPMDLDLCRDLPETKAFREALHNDPTPAMALLSRSSAPVQLAALCAIEAHRNLKQWHIDLLQRLIRKSVDPNIKAAAVLALAHVPKREIVEKLAEMLRDRSREVRQAVARALLVHIEERWPWVRTAVQHALADNDLANDGPLWPTAQTLPRDILSEIHGWTAAGGTLGARAAITLATHYRRALVEDSDPALLAELRRLVLNRQVPMTLRHELAQLLDQEGELSAQDLEFMLHSGDASPLRLFAADALLGRGEHLEAVQTLRELARVPNRELAVSTAAVVQRRMGVDLGLDLEATLPALHTRQAAEITRRVMRWAVDGSPNPVNESASYTV